jgi:hypothetical protein
MRRKGVPATGERGYQTESSNGLAVGCAIEIEHKASAEVAADRCAIQRLKIEGDEALIRGNDEACSGPLAGHQNVDLCRLEPFYPVAVRGITILGRI